MKYICTSLIFVSRYQVKSIPDENREAVVQHVVFVHQSVNNYSKEFQQKLRRNNFSTPKNYLDFINTYLKLLDEKDQFILQQVCCVHLCHHICTPYKQIRCIVVKDVQAW